MATYTNWDQYNAAHSLDTKAECEAVLQTDLYESSDTLIVNGKVQSFDRSTASDHEIASWETQNDVKSESIGFWGWLLN